MTTTLKNLSSALLPLAFVAASTAAAAVGMSYTPPPSLALYDGIMCDSDRECEEATGYPFDTAMSIDPPKYPTLVGIGCAGTDDGAPIYAFEEDHFPVGGCRDIFEMDWDWKEKLNG